MNHRSRESTNSAMLRRFVEYLPVLRHCSLTTAIFLRKKFWRIYRIFAMFGNLSYRILRQNDIEILTDSRRTR